MSTVLVAIDGSEPAARALTQAAELAAALHSRLDIVYVSLPVLLPPLTYASVIEDLTRQEGVFAVTLLSQATRTLAGSGLVVRPAHLTGSPVDTLLALAENDEVIAVVVGSRGRGAIARVLLGSVADRVVQLCKKPVLVVR